MKVKLLLDHVSRELNLAVKLRNMLAKTSTGSLVVQHQDYINRGDSYDFLRTTFDGTYDVVITPSYNVRRTPYILLRALANRSKLVIYHSEQLYNDAFNVEKLNLNALKCYQKHVAAHFVWGEFYARKLVEIAGVPRERIFIVGNYKFDFLDARAVGRELPSKKVLVASDFKIGDLDDEEFQRFKREYGVVSLPDLHKVMADARRRCVAWISDMADRFPDISFVLRPHPGELTAEYEKLKKPNVSMSVPNKSYAEDVNDSALVLGFTTTSVMEVVKSGRRLLSLDLVDFDKSFLSAHRHALEWVDKAALEDALRSVSLGETLYPREESKRKVNELVADYDDVCVNVVKSLQIVCEAQALTTRTSSSDALRLAKSLCLGLGKEFAISVAMRSRFFPLSRRVIDRSRKSYQDRVAFGEDLTDEILNAYDDDAFLPEGPGSKLANARPVLSKYGYVFN